MRMMRLTGRRAIGEVDSVYAWLRLLAGVLTSTIGGVGMWSIAVVLPTLQADFGVTRADVSLAYTAVMLGAVVGGPVMGWLSDRFGIAVPVAIGTAMLALGLALASQAATMWQFTLVHGLLYRAARRRPSTSPGVLLTGAVMMMRIACGFGYARPGRHSRRTRR
jgi:MFS family permease